MLQFPRVVNFEGTWRTETRKGDLLGRRLPQG